LLVVLMLARELDNVLFFANHMHEALKDWRLAWHSWLDIWAY